MKMFFTIDLPDADVFLHASNLQSRDNARYISIEIEHYNGISCRELERAVSDELDDVYNDPDSSIAIEALRERLFDECSV